MTPALWASATDVTSTPPDRFGITVNSSRTKDLKQMGSCATPSHTAGTGPTGGNPTSTSVIQTESQATADALLCQVRDRE